MVKPMNSLSFMSAFSLILCSCSDDSRGFPWCISWANHPCLGTFQAKKSDVLSIYLQGVTLKLVNWFIMPSWFFIYHISIQNSWHGTIWHCNGNRYSISTKRIRGFRIGIGSIAWPNRSVRTPFTQNYSGHQPFSQGMEEKDTFNIFQLFHPDCRGDSWSCKDSHVFRDLQTNLTQAM